MTSRNSKIHRLEDLKGATIGVSQYGSEADTFARNALATAGLKPDKDVTIMQLGGHPQVAAAMVAGKLEVGALAGLAALTVERSGARLLTSAVELKILSPSGTFGTTRGYIERKRSVVERLTRSFVEAIHYLKTNRSGSITLLQNRVEEGWAKFPEGRKWGSHQVVKFSPDGKLALGKAGGAGDSQDTFNRPSAVVTSSNGDIFVADGPGGDSNARIVKFSEDGKFIKA